ncbi:hypothetical protein EV643_13424 [Kribbella sp. VKM Ac-2527]|uniref:Uncharacterized protein n=1 Tax=Kribbella caucasensis TaxID=2512215 RepID=A0A4R6J6A5_9ACTN|nr:hypothetical protein [Kribbella sp. VKM Ac-2527]TDO31000.1 hypothetical protein EV643_13424 [Kribbella sp. VKM Ac-2527]
MTTLAIALEDGFDDDHVVVRINDRVVFDEEHVSSRYHSVAQMFDVPVTADEVRAAVQVPTRGLADETTLDVTRKPNLRISITAGDVVFDAGSAPLYYA